MWPHVAGPTRYGPSALIPDINPTFVEFWDYLPTPLEHVANSHTIQGITSEINIPEETPLDRAINSASESTLRAVIRAVCAKHDEARKEAESRLLAKRIDVTTDFKTGDSKIVPHFPRHGFRSACKKEFDVTTNTKQNCQYHPMPCEATGEELYEDNWDEIGVDPDETREEFPALLHFRLLRRKSRD